MSNQRPPALEGKGRSAKEAVVVYNPDHPDLHHVLANRPKELRGHLDHGRWFIHQILWKELTEDLDPWGWARLHRDILRRYMCRTEAAWRRYLETRGIIETAGYVPGEKSRGYNLLVRGPACRWPITNRLLVRKLRAFRRSRRPSGTENPELQAVVERRAFILDHLDDSLGCLTLDRPAAQLIEHLRRSGHMADPKRGGQHCSRREMQITSVCYAIEHRDYRRPFVDPNGHRVHSVATWTSRGLRPYLRLNGRPLVGVDVRNCQPLILAAILETLTRPSDQNLRAVLRPTTDRAPAWTSGESPLVAMSAFQYVGALQMWAISRREVAQFVDLAERGQLYEYLATISGMGDRERAKRRFIVDVLYDRPDDRRVMVRAFRDSFPSIYDALAGIKRAAMRDGLRRGHGVLSCLLQRVESVICIDHAAGRLVRDGSKLPFLTVHDSLLLPTEGAEAAREALCEAFRHFGIRATVEVKTLGKPKCEAPMGRTAEVKR